MKLQILALAAAAAGISIADRLDQWREASADRLEELRNDVATRVAERVSEAKHAGERLVDKLSLPDLKDVELPSELDLLDFSSSIDFNPLALPETKAEEDSGHRRRNPHDQRDRTLYELIAASKHFTKLYELIKDDSHIVQELNKTAANLTIFAPTDSAFERLEKSHHKPLKEHVKKALIYHTLGELYPAGRVLKSKTLKTLYYEEEIGAFQRLSVDINLRGLTLNYLTRVIYPDVFTNNGILHAVDSVIFKPLSIYHAAEVIPSSFSTFVNAAWRTGLVGALNETEKSTVFAPSNAGFAKLGPRINAYLFSDRGTAALRKLLKYHVVPSTLFYSDDVVVPKSDDAESSGLATHYEFETLLEGKKLNVDVRQWLRFRTIVFNGRSIGVSDVPARNGVLSKLDGVILPYANDIDYSELTEEEFDALLGVTEQDFEEAHAAKTLFKQQQASAVEHDLRDFL